MILTPALFWVDAFHPFHWDCHHMLMYKTVLAFVFAEFETCTCSRSLMNKFPKCNKIFVLDCSQSNSCSWSVFPCLFNRSGRSTQQSIFSNYLKSMSLTSYQCATACWLNLCMKAPNPTITYHVYLLVFIKSFYQLNYLYCFWLWIPTAVNDQQTNHHPFYPHPICIPCIYLSNKTICKVRHHTVLAKIIITLSLVLVIKYICIS